jgi:hypothetical protein
MELAEFVAVVPGFNAMAPRVKIIHFAWYLHVCRGLETFKPPDIRKCFDQLHMDAGQNIARDLVRMAEVRPRQVVPSGQGYKLERSLLVQLDSKYGQHPTSAAVRKELSELATVVPDLAERAFLAEAMACYKVKAYRATVVMVWNLAYDHLIRWIVADQKRVANLNAALARRFQKKPPVIGTVQDFEDLKEFDVIDVCGTANLLGSNTIRILKDKLVKRNIAAHPNSQMVGLPQVDDAISDLVHNVVLALK